mmetsp:Transcript_20713/g.57788  ORF Transcript_20713/g.57788 Transcript_20713/m.57788 type:complete len:164 (-) Transcript_20713:278-769(-)
MRVPGGGILAHNPIFRRDSSPLPPPDNEVEGAAPAGEHLCPPYEQVASHMPQQHSPMYQQPELGRNSNTGGLGQKHAVPGARAAHSVAQHKGGRPNGVGSAYLQQLSVQQQQQQRQQMMMRAPHSSTSSRRAGYPPISFQQLPFGHNPHAILSNPVFVESCSP